MKKCPYCAEEIQEEAIVCRYCGRGLPKTSVESSPTPVVHSTVSSRRSISKWKRALIGGSISTLIAGFFLYLDYGLRSSSFLAIFGLGIVSPEIIVDRIFILPFGISTRYWDVSILLLLLFWFLAGFWITSSFKKTNYAMLMWGLIYVVLFVMPIILNNEQNPQFMFKKILANPIPEGISNIEVVTLYPGDNAESYQLDFTATPNAMNYFVSNDEFVINPDADYTTAPCSLSPELDCQRTWRNYTKSDEKNKLYWSLWINIEKSLIRVSFQHDF